MSTLEKKLKFGLDLAGSQKVPAKLQWRCKDLMDRRFLKKRINKKRERERYRKKDKKGMKVKEIKVNEKGKTNIMSKDWIMKKEMWDWLKNWKWWYIENWKRK